MIFDYMYEIRDEQVPILHTLEGFGTNSIQNE